MRDGRKFFGVTALMTAMALTYPFAAMATQQAGGAEQNTDSDRLNSLREKTVSAEDLLNADVRRLDTPLGNVRDLVLNEQGTAVQYVLYEIPYPYSFFDGAENGFVSFDNLTVEPEHTFGDYVRIDDEASSQAPEQLKITRAQADHRLVSNILDDTVTFAGDQARQVEDLLIDRKTGRITGYVVNKSPGAWFNEDPRVIPAEQVKVSQQGDVTTTVEFAALETIE